MKYEVFAKSLVVIPSPIHVFAKNMLSLRLIS